MSYTMLDALNGDRDDWMIRVRLCRMWESANPNTGEKYSLDMILMDEKENIIHATLPQYLFARFKHLLNVVGCLTCVGGIKTVSGGWKNRDMTIMTDYSITATVTLWEKLAELFDTSIYKQDDGPYIIIFTSTQVKKFKDDIGFSTTRNSRIYVNLDTPYVASLRERFSEISTKLEISVDSPPSMLPEEKMFINRMTIKELLVGDWSEDIKVLTVRAEIFGIDNANGWHYIGCKVCFTKATPQDGVYTCKNCHEVIDYPLIMFRIAIKVKDKSGDTTFILFNNIAEPLLDTSANKIVNKSNNNKDIPKEFESLLGKDIIFKLRLNDYNLVEGKHNFTVGEIFEPRQVLEEEYESKKSKEIHHDEKRRRISTKEDEENNKGCDEENGADKV
ncbi:replication protein A 70 kDa DNA-binding subunit D [Daucus carota subsp. sativus]|uniref:replication protein A 70 kDa DNA-binding subunit D n=1 Tax=Daucus carota subsp. sativus TaxID=79200 RepID=UPI003083C724